MMSSIPEFLVFFLLFLKQVIEEFSDPAVFLACHWMKLLTCLRADGSWFPAIMCIVYHVIQKKKKKFVLRTPFGNFKSHQYLWNSENLFIKQNFNYASQPFPLCPWHVLILWFLYSKWDKRNGLLPEETVTGIQLLQR